MSENKILILFKSKYGATEKYAKIMKSKLNCDVINLENKEQIDLKKYEIVILAGGIYASGIAGLGFLRKHYNEIKDKNVAILCVGASPYDEKAFEEVKARNLKEDLKDIPIFYARGAWNEDIMNMKDKMLCKMLQVSIKRKDPETYEPWMKAFADSMGEKRDWVSEESIEPLIDYINSKMKEH